MTDDLDSSAATHAHWEIEHECNESIPCPTFSYECPRVHALDYTGARDNMAVVDGGWRTTTLDGWTHSIVACSDIFCLIGAGAR